MGRPGAGTARRSDEPLEHPEHCLKPTLVGNIFVKQPCEEKLTIAREITMTQNPIPKWQIITGWVLSSLLAVLFVPSAFFKMAQPGDFLEGWTKTYPAGAALPLGIIELTM